jgi:excisionase family DNA binding protein
MTGSSVASAPPHRLRVAEAAEYLRVSRQWLYKNRVRRGIPAFRVGVLLIFDRAMLDQWLEAHREEPAA